MPPNPQKKAKRAAPKRRPLTPEEQATAARVKAAFYAAQLVDPTLTQERIAAEWGVTQGAVSHYIQGRVPIPLDRLLDFALTLGVPLASLSAEVVAKFEASEVCQTPGSYAPSAIPLRAGFSAATMQRLAALPQASVDMLEVFLLERIEMFERIQSSKDRAAS